MPFSRDLIPRLTYVKQMYLHGQDHGKNPGCFNKSLAIISIDGAIERFLWTVITEYNASSKLPKEPKFHEIFRVADCAVQNKLPLKSEVLRLHNIRNLAQHQGTTPSDRDIESSVIYAEDFLTHGCAICFNTNFGEIYFSDLIMDLELRAHLKKVEDLLMNKNYERAAQEASITFNALRAKNEVFYGDKAFKKGPFMVLDLLYSIFDWGDQSEKTKSKMKTLEKIYVTYNNEIERISDRISAASLGANMQDYLFFLMNTPRAIFKIRGYQFDSPNTITYSEEKTIRILNFLFNLIIQWESLKM
jgi:hypothetical protein